MPSKPSERVTPPSASEVATPSSSALGRNPPPNYKIPAIDGALPQIQNANATSLMSHVYEFLSRKSHIRQRYNLTFVYAIGPSICVASFRSLLLMVMLPQKIPRPISSFSIQPAINITTVTTPPPLEIQALSSPTTTTSSTVGAKIEKSVSTSAPSSSSSGKSKTQMLRDFSMENRSIRTGYCCPGRVFGANFKVVEIHRGIVYIEERLLDLIFAANLSYHLWMYLVVIEEEDRLVNLPSSFRGVLWPLSLYLDHNVFSFCIPRDRWDKEFFKLQSG
ncbi:hypothetical protein Vadar_004933 [Vaccinium darrowii]|uniref:Uncharacterized protein n=1 Tax=Vaccinium darrowii TaxID=229202 RepID=A0ACB7ZAG4_9ERIC|nr:hypothetical protein Vadar_004933 [Vaccinium darrowii]